MFLLVLKAMVGLFGKSLESSGDFSMRYQCLTSDLLRRCVGKCGEYVVVVKVRRSPALWGLFASIFCLSEKLILLMLLSMTSCLYPLFSYFRHVSLCAFGM